MPSIAWKKYPAVIAAQQNVAAPQIFQPMPQQPAVMQETTRSTKQKSKALANWNLNGKNHEYLFGSSNKGQANLRALKAVIVRHHLTENVNRIKTFKYAPLCATHACGEVCARGKGCPNSHRQRNQFAYNQKDGHISGAEALAKIDKIFEDASK